MGLSEKQYEALRAKALNDARKHGISEKELDDHEGELFAGEREYLIRMNPRGQGSDGFPVGAFIAIALCVFAVMVML